MTRGRLVWAAPGRDKATLAVFFDALGSNAARRSPMFRADGADWISSVVTDRCPNAVRCADPFHVVPWATDALDEVRRQAWNEARGAVTQRRAGRSTGQAKALKHARYALWKNPENLTSRQQTKLAWIAKTDPRLHRAYLLKEGLRLVFQLPPRRPPKPSMSGSAGHVAAESRRSSTCNAGSRNTGPRSSPRSSTASRTDASSRSTPRSDSSPGSPSDSDLPTPSSPSPCSASAVTHPYLPGRT